MIQHITSVVDGQLEIDVRLIFFGDFFLENAILVKQILTTYFITQLYSILCIYVDCYILNNILTITVTEINACIRITYCCT